MECWGRKLLGKPEEEGEGVEMEWRSLVEDLVPWGLQGEAVPYEMSSDRHFWTLRRMTQQKRARAENDILGSSGLEKGTGQSGVHDSSWP